MLMEFIPPEMIGSACGCEVLPNRSGIIDGDPVHSFDCGVITTVCCVFDDDAFIISLRIFGRYCNYQTHPIL